MDQGTRGGVLLFFLSRLSSSNLFPCEHFNYFDLRRFPCTYERQYEIRIPMLLLALRYDPDCYRKSLPFSDRRAQFFFIPAINNPEPCSGFRSQMMPSIPWKTYFVVCSRNRCFLVIRLHHR